MGDREDAGAGDRGGGEGVGRGETSRRKACLINQLGNHSASVHRELCNGLFWKDMPFLFGYSECLKNESSSLLAHAHIYVCVHV